MKGFRARCRVGALAVLFVSVVITALYGLLKPISSGCIMTYMYPTYIPISTPANVSSDKYGLFLYHEGWKKIDFAEHLKKLSGVPILFIPGNGGSYKQVRSLAAESSRAYQSGPLEPTFYQEATILPNEGRRPPLPSLPSLNLVMGEEEVIPVIDLLKLPAENEKLLEACQGAGCFRVVNHGIRPELQAEMKAAVRSLFDLPGDIKRRNSDVISGSGYVGPTRENPLYEAFGLYDAASAADVDAFCARLHASPHQREIIRSYASKLHGLIVGIACKVAESLGLGSYSFTEWPAQFRINKYNFTKETVGSAGVQIHTDSGFLTVLQEDESVGGLEVMNKSGSFVAVDPVPGTFLVNLGDVATAWSNGRLHNVKHRVQCKEAAPRVSMALFLLAPKDDKVEPPAILVDSKHPRLYKTFTYDDYRKLRLSSGSRAGEALSLLPTH